MHTLPTIDMVRTGCNITRLRKESGLSVRDLQKMLGFTTPQAIYKWQQGRALPTLDNLVALAAVFGVKIDDILVYQDSFRISLIA
jgi:transcriptional regulator with XRE-family HTH domain